MKEPKLTLTYIGTDGHVIDFDFMKVLEAVDAAKGAFAFQYKQNKNRDEYHVTYCERQKDIPEYCKEIDLKDPDAWRAELDEG
jgi:hypothetical protein